MDFRTATLGLVLACATAVFTRAESPGTSTDLMGNWESTIEAGKFKIRIIVRLSKAADGRISGKIDIPDQGAKDIPVSAVLCNLPAVRWEVDPFDNAAFNGTLDSVKNEIAGAFDEGPGGRPLPAVFKRVPDAPPVQYSYTFAPGEPRDFRGYWEATIEEEPDNPTHVGLKIGHAPDGKFEVLLALLDHGVQDASASSVVSTNSTLKLDWQLFRLSFEAALAHDGNELTGTWKQNGKPIPVRFARLSAPATALPRDVSFVPEGTSDVRGEWKGTLEVTPRPLRLVIKIGKTPAGVIAGTLSSLDQGGNEIPMTRGELTNSVVRLEWKAMHGVYKGTLAPDGNTLDGTWEQFGPGLKLKLERVSTPAKDKAKSD